MTQARRIRLSLLCLTIAVVGAFGAVQQHSWFGWCALNWLLGGFHIANILSIIHLEQPEPPEDR